MMGFTMTSTSFHRGMTSCLFDSIAHMEFVGACMEEHPATVAVAKGFTSPGLKSPSASTLRVSGLVPDPESEIAI
jgi:hypothetical protein